MDKQQDKFDFNTNWYELWMKQSKEFFETAEKNLKDLFGKGAVVNPEDHLEQIRQWQENLKKHWQFIQLNEQLKEHENYWKTMIKLCNEASDKMVQEWIKRNREHDPVKNIRELYEVWLNCCNEVYSKAMHTKTYQETYGEFMNAALKYWKSSMPK